MTSGRGTMLRYLLQGCADGSIPGSVVAVASNIDCPALAVAREAAVPHIVYRAREHYASRAERDTETGTELLKAGVDFIVVAGYTEPLDKGLLDLFPDRAISMYPALLPAFGELDEAIGPALDHGVKTIGMTFHFRAPDSVSAGPIIAQEPLPVDVDDTVETVMPKLVDIEIRMLFDILTAFVEGRISRVGNKVHFHD
ncbi:phosphoribosylglycinamide formyltransferase [Streptomyces sp. NPDC059989]|uniref:phosphoribosylglycinamide formyltransferase n=1 Tax=Streptomyces sp. NPDC059989 TaxID=3347026 RepID=UPI003683A57B